MLDRPEAHLGKLAEQAEADLICFGHIHIPYHRAVTTESGRIAHFVSDGSVGKPKDGDPRACWAEIVIGSAEEVETALAARRVGRVRGRCVGGRAVPSGDVRRRGRGRRGAGGGAAGAAGRGAG